MPPCHWLTKLEKSVTCSVKAARTARAKWRCLGFDQPQAPGTVEKLLQVYKVESCQQQRRFRSCKHLSLLFRLWTLFSFSTVKVRVMASLNRIACLFLSLQFSLIHCDSVTCIYPLQYTLTQSPIHTCFTYCTAYPHALGQLLRTTDQASDNIEAR